MQLSRAWLFALVVAASGLTVFACGGGSGAPACARGKERCACYANATCNAGLTCLSNTCVNTGATGGASGSGGDAGGTAGSGGSGGSIGPGTGGSSAAGTGGSDSCGTGGSSAGGTGGSNAGGTGCSSAAGTGGSSAAGTGGSSVAGRGGAGGTAGSGGTGGSVGSGGSGGSSVPSYPSSCAAYRVAHPATATDGAYTLYLAGQTDRPFPAYCADMATTSPLTYLTLPNHSQTVNISSYDATTVGTTTVLTQWTRVRFDPEAIAIIPSDFRFSASTGYVTHENTTQVPYGVARDCSQMNKALGIGNVDLRGLPFAVIPNWTLGGYVPFGMTTITAFYQSVDITGGGSCGWNAPGGDRNGGTTIPLRWCPTPSAEICKDGLDNDCDGVVDNGC